MEKGELTFITGGVRSGKSAFAEQFAIKRAQKKQLKLHYVACGVPFDKEMKERIARHQKDRELSEVQWNTWEQEVELATIASAFTNGDLILLDCITTLVNNYLFREENLKASEVLQLAEKDIGSIHEHAGEVILVSNEVFQDKPFQHVFTRNYQYILGKLHQQIVRLADTAIVVESGMPLWKKGCLS